MFTFLMEQLNSPFCERSHYNNMAQIFGDFIEQLPNGPEYLVIGFSPSSVPLKQRWRNNGLSADFLADYLTTFFPAQKDDDLGKRKQEELKGAVSYVANELLENAMKFNDEHQDYPISISLHLQRDRLVFAIQNTVVPTQLKEFQNYLTKLLQSDPQEMLLEQLEQNAEYDHPHSRLGYLTMMNDYHARLGWKFEELEYEGQSVITVKTMVQLDIE